MQPKEAAAAPTRALVADVIVPTAAGVPPLIDIKHSEYAVATAMTARRRNISPPGGLDKRILIAFVTVNAICIPCVRYFHPLHLVYMTLSATGRITFSLLQCAYRMADW